MSPMADLGPDKNCSETFIAGITRHVPCLRTGCTRCWVGRSEAERRVLSGGGCADCSLCVQAANDLIDEGFVFTMPRGHDR